MKSAHLDILEICRRALVELRSCPTDSTASIASNSETELLQDIKKNFFNRDYLDVFMTSAEHLCVYFKHYVPSRSLCYFDLISCNVKLSDVFSGKALAMLTELERRRLRRRGISVPPVQNFDEFEISCIGAGAGSEQIAVISFLVDLLGSHSVKALDIPEDATYSEFCDGLQGGQCGRYKLNIFDIADWSAVQRALNALNSPSVTFDFMQCDILTEYSDETVATKLNRSSVVTFMFVLNELFAVSKERTVEMLRFVIENLAINSHILFVESAGSFSEISVGSKEFKVFALLDKIKRLRCIASSDSEWFRSAPHLSKLAENSSNGGFPLTNMRYFYRLYQTC
eukprot:Partr_v1_DN27894_c1_g1_i2_m22648 putative Conserved hypothetical protein